MEELSITTNSELVQYAMKHGIISSKDAPRALPNAASVSTLPPLFASYHRDIHLYPDRHLNDVTPRYPDRYLMATQVEYRLSLLEKFGTAAFGGIDEVNPGGKEIFRINVMLLSVGGGPRFEQSKKYHVYLRARFARGKDSWTWNIGVGEALGRNA